jgi:hypothetical protein
MSEEIKLISMDKIGFNKFELYEEEIMKWTSEDQFMKIGVELFKEVSKITSVIANIAKIGNDGQIRDFIKNELIISGNLIRLSKLEISYIQQICENKREIAEILSRCIFETVINLEYFLKNRNNNEIFQEYIKYSYLTDKRQYDDIHEQIKARGYELPIEKRMLSSINKNCIRDGIDIKLVEKNTFPTILDRVKEVYGERSYLFIQRVQSHPIHGNWKDIFRNHIKYESGNYFPNNEWNIPRPQMLGSIQIFIIEFLLKYLKSEIPECDEKQFFIEHLESLNQNVMLIEELHENFLNEETV